jgi:hypothetical protein
MLSSELLLGLRLSAAFAVFPAALFFSQLLLAREGLVLIAKQGKG